MDSRRISSKLRAGLCLVWVAVAVGVVPWGEAWGDDGADDLRQGPSTTNGDLVFGGGAREAEGMGTNGRVDDDFLGNPSPPVIVSGGGARPGEGDTSASLASSSGEAQQQASSPILNYDFTGLSGLLAKFNNQPK